MHVGINGHGHGHAYGHLIGRGPAKAEEIRHVVRNDGAGPREAAEERREAAEHRRDAVERPGRERMAESVMVAKFADFLAEKASETSEQSDIAKALLNRLDGDDSGGLNSEEIAGTRLAEHIGDGFYELDGDKNGALDEAELTNFILSHFLGEEEAPGDGDAAEGAEAPDGVAAVEDLDDAPDAGLIDDGVQAVEESADTGNVDETAPVEETGEAAAPEPSASVTYAESIRSAFEAALAVLQNGTDTRSSYDVVSALYGDVQDILNGDA